MFIEQLLHSQQYVKLIQLMWTAINTKKQNKKQKTASKARSVGSDSSFLISWPLLYLCGHFLSNVKAILAYFVQCAMQMKQGCIGKVPRIMPHNYPQGWCYARIHCLSCSFLISDGVRGSSVLRSSHVSAASAVRKNTVHLILWGYLVNENITLPTEI